MSNGEVKRWWLRQSTARKWNILDVTARKEYSREGDVEVMRVEDHERIVAELKADIARLELVAMAAAESIKEKYKILDTQKRVIEKLKGMVSHYETCATVDRYDDEKVPCDCGLEKELAAIEKGEE